jgi:UDP-2-acetamido-3-amino-2,3-dideoxy-glucuronate N-acetyltransferase
MDRTLLWTEVQPLNMIDDTAVIRGNVFVEDGVDIGCFCVIENYDEKKLIIRKGTIIKNYCEVTGFSELGENLFLGSYSFIRSKSVIGCNVQIGSRCEIHPQCSIGDFVRMQGSNNLGSGTKIGHFVWIFPGCTFTNDKNPPSGIIAPSEVGDFAVIMASCLIHPGIKVGKSSVIGAGSEVKNNIKDHFFAKGSPAKEYFLASKLRHSETMRPAYPWYERYTKGTDIAIIKEYLQRSEG